MLQGNIFAKKIFKHILLRQYLWLLGLIFQKQGKYCIEKDPYYSNVFKYYEVIHVPCLLNTYLKEGKQQNLLLSLIFLVEGRVVFFPSILFWRERISYPALHMQYERLVNLQLALILVKSLTELNEHLMINLLFWFVKKVTSNE